VNVPDWYELILLSLAAWRVFQLIALDDITDPLRRYVTQISKSTGKAKRETLLLFIECPYCAGFWIGLLWWVAWLLWPHGTTVAAVPFAISAGVIAAAKVLSSE
jgi:hypothetical protein